MRLKSNIFLSCLYNEFTNSPTSIHRKNSHEKPQIPSLRRPKSPKLASEKYGWHVYDSTLRFLNT